MESMHDSVPTIISPGRAWPIPRRPWSVRMIWHDLLFAHWPLLPEALQPLLPPGLKLDTLDGQAWLGIVPFRMTGIRHRWLPPVPGLSAFPELNVRTYVTANGKPGVWFFTLDATNRPAIAGARKLFHLQYRHARITCTTSADGWIDYTSRRRERSFPPAEFVARYRPRESQQIIATDLLTNWLTARYCLYSADRQGQVWRGEIDHAPWQLAAAEAEIETNSLVTGLGLELPPTEPLLHFSRRLDAVAWTLDRVG